nr:hypothetical protein [Tanacetum cinerariifolium]
ATPSSPVSAPTAKELADQQAAILKAKRQELLEQELKQSLDAEQVYLDSLVALNLTNEEWIGLVDQVRANPTFSAELLGADVSEDTFSVRMRIATLEAELKATKILYRDTVVLFAKRIKKLESKLKTKKRKLVLSDSENEEEAKQSQELDSLLDLANAALHELSDSTTPSKPANQEQSSE